MAISSDGQGAPIDRRDLDRSPAYGTSVESEFFPFFSLKFDKDAVRMVAAGANRIGSSGGIQIVEEELRRKAEG